MDSRSRTADVDLCALHGRRPQLSVSHDDVDAELTKALSRVEAPVLLHHRAGLERFIRTITACNERGSTQVLDLIAHSTAGKHLLDFDGWRIGDDQELLRRFCDRLAQDVDIRRFDKVRLIGCGTATTIAGRATMDLMERGLGINVEGTTGLVYRDDFGPRGFLGTRLVGSSVVERMSFDGPPSTRVQRAFDPSRLTRLPRDAIRATSRPRLFHPYAALERDAMRWIPDDRARLLPGLLTRPRLEIVFEVPGLQAELVLTEVLFAWTYLRVYPTDVPDGLLYKLTPELRAALAAVPDHRDALRAADAAD
jgi:hypothetical protein